MPAVHLDSVSFSYTSAVEVIADVTLSLASGWTGLVGENGVGKSTLIGLITGRLTPTSGRVALDPADAVVAWCPQVVDEPLEAVTHFAGSWESADAALRARLALDPDDLTRWLTLSPGERRRWQLAAAIARRPDVLCIDEPTNHLDAVASGVLVDLLEGLDVVGVVVSHDRSLLDRLTGRTLRMTGRGIEMWSGSYSVARREWLAAEDEMAAERARLRRERARTRRRLADRRRKMAETESRDRTRRRTAGPADSDARSIVIKGRQEMGLRSASGAAGADARRLQRLDEELAGGVIERKRGGSVEVEGETPRRRTLLDHKGSLVAEDVVLVDELSVVVDRETRLRVTGANGAGKTTLLRSLVEGATIPSDRILWLPQELDSEQRRKVIQRLRSLPAAERGEVMAVAARLGIDPGRVLESDEPSPGEARKLWLAEGLGRGVWVAVLDEPTNHLDLPSIERLEHALLSYDGALVIVSHDDRFASPLVNETLEL